MNRIQQIAISLLTVSSLAVVSLSASAEDLLQVYQQAAASDPVLRAEEAAFEASTQANRQATAGYLPNVAFQAQQTNTDQELLSSSSGSPYTAAGNVDTTTFSLSLKQALYRRDVLTQMNQAEAAVRQAEASLNATRQGLITRVAERYFNVLAAKDNLEFAQAEKNAIARQLEQTKQRFEVGLIAITDVHESQAAHDLATASEIVAQNQLAASRQALRELTGQLPQDLLPLIKDVPLISPEPAAIEQWVETALNQNYSNLAAEAAVAVAEEGLNQRRAGHHPTLDLVASKSRADSDSDLSGQYETDNTSISLQLNVPLYQGGGVSASISEGRAQLTQAREALEQQRRATQREANDAYLGVLAGISRVKALKQAVISSNSALEATQAGYDVGTRTTVDVLNARRELFRTQRDYARARYDYILASLRLKQAAGLLSAEDLQQINSWLAS